MVAGATLIVDGVALAQEPIATPGGGLVAAPSPAATAAAEAPGRLGRLLEMAGGSGLLIVGVIIFLAVVGVVIYMLTSRHAGEELVELGDHECMESSKFEQVLAEIQGLSLRVQGGDGKGYYRKIEQLARIFLERVGYPGARSLTYSEVETLLTGGSLPPKQASVLTSIFERCRLGAEHEGAKPENSTADLLRDLRMLIKQTEETPARQAS
jgi:hypothetical protein